MLSSVHPMLTTTKLLEQGIVIPDLFIDVLTPRHISKAFFKECKNEGKIYTIPTSEDDYLVATSGSITSIISMCIKRIREGFKNSTILSYVAKLQSLALMELKRDLLSNNPAFWRKLSVTILDAKEEILQKSRTLNRDFFTANEIIRFFSENELKAMEKKRAEDQEMYEEMKTIALEISHKDSFFLNQSELNKVLEKNQKKWSDFKEKFYENFVTVKKKTQLPQIIYIGQKYIHRDNIYTYFITQLAEYSADLRIEYQKLMESILRTNNRLNITVFFSKDNLRSNIREKLNDWDPMISFFLDRPSIVSESVIHVAKKKMNIKEVGRIKVMLEKYFEPGRLRFKPLEELYDLDILEIFQYAFLKIPIWKQFFIRILGRYDSYRKSYTSMSIQPKGKKENQPFTPSVKKENIPDFSQMSKEERKLEFRRRQSLNYNKTRKSSSSFTEQPSNNKQYSLKERNEAWSDFNTSFNKKKKAEKKKKR